MREDVFWVVVGRENERGRMVWMDGWVSRHWKLGKALDSARRQQRRGWTACVVSREHVGGGQYIGRSFDVDGRELSYRFE